MFNISREDWVVKNTELIILSMLQEFLSIASSLPGQLETVPSSEPVPEQGQGGGGQVPDRVAVYCPPERGELKQLQQDTEAEDHDGHHAFLHVRSVLIAAVFSSQKYL